MIDFETDRPTLYWMHSDGNSGWRTDLLGTVIINPQRIAFDYPIQGINVDEHVVELKQEPDLSYAGGSKQFRYEGVRAETETHVVLTGKWRSQGPALPERGLFVAVLPKENFT